MIDAAEATKTCPKPKCGAPAAKAGKRADGLQRYRCTLCGKTFSDRKEQENVFGTKQAVDDAKALLGCNCWSKETRSAARSASLASTATQS